MIKKQKAASNAPSKIVYWFIFFAAIVSVFYVLIQHEPYHFGKQQECVNISEYLHVLNQRNQISKLANKLSKYLYQLQCNIAAEVRVHNGVEL